MPIERIWLQEHDRKVREQARAEAIDEFAEKCNEEIFKHGYPLDALDITVIAEQMKEGGKDE